jgi:putative oxidoreductase
MATAQIPWSRPAAGPVGLDAGLTFLARVCLAQAFMVFGVRKFLHPEQIYGFITSYHIPGVPGELVYLAMPWQICWGYLTFFGYQTRLAALSLAFFCVAAPSIFWLGSLENLTRDYCVAGGFVMLFYMGAGRISIDAILAKHGWRDALERFFAPTVERLHAGKFKQRALLAARVLIVLPFLADAIKKMIYFTPQVALFEKSGVSGSLVWLYIGVETFCGIAILANYRTILSAAALIVLASVSAFILHDPAIGVLSGDPTHILSRIFVINGGNMMTFEKDVGSIGALLILIVSKRRAKLAA